MLRIHLSSILKFLGLMFLTILLLFPLRFFIATVFFIFQDRDLSRAHELLNGNFIFFGPELTGGGNLPGPFYYFLLAPVLSLGFGWMGAWCWMIILLALGGVVGWYFFRSEFDSLTAFLWLFVFAFICPIAQVIEIFVNPSFSVLFTVLINIYILKAFSENNRNKREQAFVLACFFVGLSIQLHYSNLPYLLALLSLQIFSNKLRILSISVNKFYTGLAVFSLTLAPYGIGLILTKLEIHLGQPLSYSGATIDALPSLFNHFKTVFDSRADDFLLTVVKKLFLAVPVVFLVLISLRLVFRGKSTENLDFLESKLLTSSNSSLIKISSICALFSFIPFSFYFFVPQGSWYGMPFGITISFMAVIIYGSLIKLKDELKLFNIISMVALTLLCALILFLKYFSGVKAIVINLLIFISYLFLVAGVCFDRRQKNNSAILISFVLTGVLVLAQVHIQNQIRKDIHAGTSLPRYLNWQKIWSKIYKDTGWSYSEVRERIYFINHQMEQDPEAAYQLLIKQSSKNNSILSKLPDGYFVSIDEPEQAKTLEWIVRQPIQEEVRRGLLSGEIVLGEYNSNDNILIAPYFVVSKKFLPNYFHNIGAGYDQLPEAKLFDNIKESEGAKALGDNQYLFKWNECPDQHSYCDNGVIVRINQIQPYIYKFDIKIVGLPQSQSSKWIAPGWTQAWINPYLEIVCEQKTEVMQIISSIGYNPKYLSGDDNFKFPMKNNSILAPFERSFEVQCAAGSLSELGVGRNSSVVERVLDFLNLPKKKLTIVLRPH